MAPFSPLKYIPHWSYNRLNSSTDDHDSEPEIEKCETQVWPSETPYLYSPPSPSPEPESKPISTPPQHPVRRLVTTSPHTMPVYLLNRASNTWHALISIRSARIEGNITPWLFSTLFFALLTLIVSFGGGKRRACDISEAQEDAMRNVTRRSYSYVLS